MERYREALAMLNRVQDIMTDEGETLISANLATPIHLLKAAISRKSIQGLK